jgi:hypothetical protein
MQEFQTQGGTTQTTVAPQNLSATNTTYRHNKQERIVLAIQRHHREL